MKKSLIYALVITDVLFLLYWSIAAADLINLISVPESYMYKDASMPRVVAWNWSFVTIDVAFSIFGLSAVRAFKTGDASWRPKAIVSLVLTCCAGIMAIGYWTILGEFDPFWYIPNFILFAWPLFFLPGLVKETARATENPSSSNSL